MNCLENFVGLLACTQEEPLSGLFINDFPGMGMELLENISTPEQSSYAGFWASTQRVAYSRIKMDIQRALYVSAQARFDQVLFRSSKNFVQQWSQIDALAPSAQLRGVFVSVNGSKYLGLKIKELYIYNSGSITIEDVPYYGFQCQDGKILLSDTVTLLPGMNVVPVNEIFISDFDKINMLFAVDCTNLPTLTGMFVDGGWDQMDMECATRFSYLSANGWSIFPATAPLGYSLGDNWSQDNSQSGVYFNAELVCSIDQFICSEKDYILNAWANLLCYQILWSKISSPRANYFAQNNRELTERNMATFLDNYNQNLATWAMQLNLRGEDLCFNCDDATFIQRGSVRP